eukprot:CAMPEP_0184363974 /NCGR_PEP_ID=MMETSP1089-20130417/142151_1 /TAXON_ID=38269 ORGANISM="Gloeochaete wittrockiana, Strain SAG46.84" /NCGR_SAMPLE_ID=MMETSP1089 /ASSEMBLY_ACC=CAM_ASM_000445 /LENGTH=62 /DNA_ID=CAMNT_0026704677 /DNA_START=72 /DNA_END=257 /DNA_ORIENTATION=-
MTKALNDAHEHYRTQGHFMVDLDWDHRRATLNSVETLGSEYYENFNDYAKKVVDIIYKSDEA